MRRILPVFAWLLAASPGQQSVAVDSAFKPWFGSAYDRDRDRLVLFSADGLTRELHDGVLLRRTTTDSGMPTPPPRLYPTMVYDAARKHVLLFGGLAQTNLNDTWIYDGARWTQLTAGPTPGARDFAGATFDSVRNRVLMVGGQLRFQSVYNDTWEHDGAQWTRRVTTTPYANQPALTFDHARGVAVLVQSGSFFGGPAQTWEWDGNTWSERLPAGAWPIGGTALAYDPVRGRSVLCGGGSQTAAGTTIRPGADIWEWDGVAWTRAAQLVTPLRRECVAWFDARRGRVVVAGGDEPVGSPDATLTWDGVALQPLHQLPARPNVSYGHAWSAGPDGSLLFGGNAGGSASGATWTWDGNEWHRVVSAIAPPARLDAAATFDLFGQRTLLFGGSGNGGFLGDFWAFDGQGWQALPPGPPPRANAALCHDLLRFETVLFGGSDGPVFQSTGVRGDTWVWNGTWQPRPALVSPSPRERAAMAFDFNRGVTVLFGGRTGATIQDQLADTWEWDGVLWTRRTTPTTPPALLQPSLVFDFSQSCLLLTGTLLIPPTPYRAEEQLWQLTATDWQQLAARPMLPNSALAAYDLAHSAITLCDGTAVREWTLIPASTATFGSGCGTPPPRLFARSLPRAGETHAGLELFAGAAQPCAFAVDNAAGSTPLGGACALLLGNAPQLFFGASDGSGLATLPWTVPAALLGANLFAQAAVLDPTTPIGLGVSNGVRITVGR